MGEWVVSQMCLDWQVYVLTSNGPFGLVQIPGTHLRNSTRVINVAMSVVLIFSPVRRYELKKTIDGAIGYDSGAQNVANRLQEKMFKKIKKWGR